MAARPRSRPKERPRRAVIIEVSPLVLEQAFGLPSGMRIEQITADPEDWFSGRWLALVTGDDNRLPIVTEGQRIPRATITVREIRPYGGRSSFKLKSIEILK